MRHTPHVEKKIVSDYTWIWLPSNITMENEARIREEMLETLKNNPKNIVIDLLYVKWITSVYFKVIFHMVNYTQKEKGAIFMVNVPSDAYDLFSHMNITKKIPIFQHESEFKKYVLKKRGKWISK